MAFFTYSFTGTPTTKIPANPDGTAEIAFTPTRGGPSGLTVRAVDRAGNLSPSSLYSIDVAYW